MSTVTQQRAQDARLLAMVQTCLGVPWERLIDKLKRRICEKIPLAPLSWREQMHGHNLVTVARTQDANECEIDTLLLLLARKARAITISGNKEDQEEEDNHDDFLKAFHALLVVALERNLVTLELQATICDASYPLFSPTIRILTAHAHLAAYCWEWHTAWMMDTGMYLTWAVVSYASRIRDGWSQKFEFSVPWSEATCLAYGELLLAHGKTDCWQVDESVAYVYEWLTRYRLSTHSEFHEALRQRRQAPPPTSAQELLQTSRRQVDVADTLVWLIETACVSTQRAAHLASARRICNKTPQDDMVMRMLGLIDAAIARVKSASSSPSCLQSSSVFRDCITCGEKINK
jgi:hypothetical protein